MSMGYGGYAHLSVADDTQVIYSYCAYNVNQPNWEYSQHAEDGELYIDRDAFVEPEIHEKRVRSASGRKRTVSKRAKRIVPVSDLLSEGKITVKNASGAWNIMEYGIDSMAYRLLGRIFDEYQETGIIPKAISWFS